ncbi:hypothetical protein EDD11_000109 [Mortierella claussenii]|nr:hypothetical protein EDD11_000109 [Mortierella claussenii]
MAPDPRIIIVGGGIAGLGLALMFERAGMHRYIILEKAAEIRPLGSAICLSAIMLRCFEQMGLLEEVIAISKPCVGNVFLDEELSQTNESAQVRCSDNSIFQADIVIGADGAYSGIRQSLYKSIQGAPKRSAAKLEKSNVVTAALKKVAASTSPTFIGKSSGGGGRVGSKGEIRLPASDQAPLRFDQHAVVGIAKGLDPEAYPVLKAKSCQVVTILGKNGLSAWLFPVTRNRICWAIASRSFETPQEQAQAARGIAANFKISEWGPEAVDRVLQLDYVKNQKSPFGGTLQNLFDQTEKGTPVRIMLEDKVFKTWYHKRTVLVGDACHKIIPFSGVGTLQAMLDCIILANALYDMPDGRSFTSGDVTRAFQSYYAQRAEDAAAAVKASSQVSDFVSNTSGFSRLIRKATLASMPQFMVTIVADRVFANRPILSYLPFVPDYGTRKSNPQPLGRRDREELEMLMEQERKMKKDKAKALKEERRIGRDEIAAVRSGALKDGVGRILKAAATASTYRRSVAPTLHRSIADKALLSRAASSAATSSNVTPNVDTSVMHIKAAAALNVAAVEQAATDPGAADSETRISRDKGCVRIKKNEKENGDAVSITDTSSIFSFSSRYTLPYDTSDLEREAYTYYGGRGASIYLNTPEVAAEREAAAQREPSNPSISALWRRYAQFGHGLHQHQHCHHCPHHHPCDEHYDVGYSCRGSSVLTPSTVGTMDYEAIYEGDEDLAGVYVDGDDDDDDESKRWGFINRLAHQSRRTPTYVPGTQRGQTGAGTDASTQSDQETVTPA